MINEWNGLADLLANLIEKYASELNLDQMPYPDDKHTSTNIDDSVIEKDVVA